MTGRATIQDRPSAGRTWTALIESSTLKLNPGTMNRLAARDFQ